MFDFSPIQIIIVLAIALLVFGPKRLPSMGRDLGRGIRDFKAGITGEDPTPVTAVQHEAVPTAQELLNEAATPQPVAEELEAARTRTAAGAPSA